MCALTVEGVSTFNSEERHGMSVDVSVSDASQNQLLSSVPWKDRTPAERLAAAQELLQRTRPPFEDLRDLAFALKDNDKRFTHARRLLVRARRHDDFKKQNEKWRR